MLKYRIFTFNPFGEKCAVGWDETGDGVVIDPGCYDGRETDELMEGIAGSRAKIKAVLLTHGHFDHIFGLTALLRRLGAKVPVYMNPEDKVILENDAAMAESFSLKAPDTSFVTSDIADGDVLKFGKTSFKVISTPGHTPGSVCFYDEADKVLFSGDTLFAGSIGRTDNKWGDYDKMIVAIMDKIMGLDGDTVVLPGHGPATTIGTERTHNPFLQPFNEPGEDEDINWDDDGLDIDGGVK